MNNIKLVTAMINSLYEQLVDLRFSNNRTRLDNKTAILFCVDLSSNCFGYDAAGVKHADWEGSSCARMFVMITSDHRVFIHEGERDTLSVRTIPQGDWRHVSSHESCWRSSYEGRLSELGRKVVDDAYSRMPKSNGRNPYDSCLTLDLRMGPIGKLFRLVEIDYVPDRDLDEDGYLKKITSVKFTNKELLV